MYGKLVAILIENSQYTIGYLQYGKTRIWADIGSYETVINSIKRKHLYYISKYSFYEQIK
jgi:hypothetical protein